MEPGAVLRLFILSPAASNCIKLRQIECLLPKYMSSFWFRRPNGGTKGIPLNEEWCPIIETWDIIFCRSSSSHFSQMTFNWLNTSETHSEQRPTGGVSWALFTLISPGSVSCQVLHYSAWITVAWGIIGTMESWKVEMAYIAVSTTHAQLSAPIQNSWCLLSQYEYRTSNLFRGFICGLTSGVDIPRSDRSFGHAAAEFMNNTAMMSPDVSWWNERVVASARL